MSDWQVGDLALCVCDSCPLCDGECDLPEAEIGRIYTVCGITPLSDGLVFDLEEMGVDPNWGFCDTHFRKIRPDEREACEPEFVTLLKRKTVRA